MVPCTSVGVIPLGALCVLEHLLVDSEVRVGVKVVVLGRCVLGLQRFAVCPSLRPANAKRSTARRPGYEACGNVCLIGVPGTILPAYGSSRQGKLQRMQG